MKTVSTLVFVGLALSVVAADNTTAPASKPKPEGITDDVVLNYALTLEHLENAFYSGALKKFDEKAFTDAGLPSTARARFAQVAEHEAAHVKFLSTALGDKATAACEYNFPYTDPVTFAALAQVLEGVGVSAYVGAARFITNADYLTAAASILSTEARHASYVAAAVNEQAPWSGDLDVPLGFNQIYSLASQFITRCPTSNPPLPVKAFPTFSLEGSATPGNAAEVKYDTAKITTSGAPLYVAFYTGFSQVYAEVKDGKATIPKELVGIVYAVLSTNGTVVTDESTVGGVAVLSFPDAITKSADGASPSKSGKGAQSGVPANDSRTNSGAVLMRGSVVTGVVVGMAGLFLAL